MFSKFIITEIYILSTDINLLLISNFVILFENIYFNRKKSTDTKRKIVPLKVVHSTYNNMQIEFRDFCTHQKLKQNTF